ncbi:hypothetical protein FS837_007455 [Tulasnella sp. UAMH 9824]|nr:hypothetical protein FS837_007455 [Tulasnella sp. UAMH 9824]
MSEKFSVEVGQFDPSKISPPDLVPDAYGNNGRNIIEEDLAPKLDPRTRIPIPPTIPTGFAQPATEAPEIPGTVGILGAGVGGLYAAMILHSLSIPFEILEASDRTGGRVFTYQFSDQSHDYFDVGPMRYPYEPAMRRLFHLFTSHQLNSDDRRVAEKLIPYIFSSPNSFRYFNQVRLRADQVPPGDPFGFRATGVPNQDLTEGYSAILDDTFGSFVQGLRQDLVPPGSRRGWQRMMRQDNHSARSYMSVACNLPMPTIHWCETMDTSTDSYDKAFSEACLDMVAFGTDQTEWWCLDPGSLHLNTRVTGLRTVGADEVVGITVLQGEKKRTYQHVISTIPLPVFRTLDLDDERLFNVQQTNALRELSYGPSVKVGMKFRSQWWAENGLNIFGGQSYTDLNIRTTVYPSYGQEDPGKTTVLIASYTWTSDAAAMGALVGSDEETRARLTELVLRDLARVHNVDVAMLRDQLVDIFPWAWQNDPLTQGAFAFFGPGQFGRLYRNLTRPCGRHHLHMAGEALSARHAWIVGALDASWRAVAHILLRSYPDRYPAFISMWGKNEEWIPSRHFMQQINMENTRWGDNIELDLVLLNILGNDPDLLGNQE